MVLQDWPSNMINRYLCFIYAKLVLMLGSIFLGLLMLVIGVVIVVFRRNIYNFTGYIDFVEGWFPGGTNTFILFFGLALVLLGIFFITGVGSSITAPINDQLKAVFGGVK